MALIAIFSVPRLSVSAGSDENGETQSENNTGSTKRRNLAGPVAGGVIGGLALLAGIIGLTLFWRRRYLNRKMMRSDLVPIPNQDLYTPRPFDGSPSTHQLISPVSDLRTSPSTLIISPSGKVVMQSAPQVPLPPVSEKTTLAISSIPSPPPATDARSASPQTPFRVTSQTEAGSSEVDELRAEMDRLRQEVTILHADRIVDDRHSESLPRYGDS